MCCSEKAVLAQLTGAKALMDGVGMSPTSKIPIGEDVLTVGSIFRRGGRLVCRMNAPGFQMGQGWWWLACYGVNGPVSGRLVSVPCGEAMPS